jgi:choline dehydrogenase-like flavoprotein
MTIAMPAFPTHLNNRRLPVNRGKALGGSTSINWTYCAAWKRALRRCLFHCNTNLIGTNPAVAVGVHPVKHFGQRCLDLAEFEHLVSVGVPAFVIVRSLSPSI